MSLNDEYEYIQLPIYDPFEILIDLFLFFSDVIWQKKKWHFIFTESIENSQLYVLIIYQKLILGVQLFF